MIRAQCHIYTSHILTYNPVSGYQHLTPVGEGSTHILIYNPVSGYQHLTAAGEGSTHILTYNPVSRFTHISDISDQFLKKKTYFESHITKQSLYKI